MLRGSALPARLSCREGEGDPSPETPSIAGRLEVARAREAAQALQGSLGHWRLPAPSSQWEIRGKFRF